jgi:hypothetical protein
MPTFTLKYRPEEGCEETWCYSEPDEAFAAMDLLLSGHRPGLRTRGREAILGRLGLVQLSIAGDGSDERVESAFREPIGYGRIAPGEDLASAWRRGDLHKAPSCLPATPRGLLWFAGDTLYGANWKTPLAEALGVAEKTVTRWAFGKTELTFKHPVWTGLQEIVTVAAQVVHSRADRLDALAKYLSDHTARFI